MVLCDIGVFCMLLENEFKVGYVEVVKYGFICDVEFFDWLDFGFISVNVLNFVDVI